MKIGVFDGSISFETGRILRSEDRVSFLATQLGKQATSDLVSNVWWHVKAEPEPGITSVLLFNENRLDRVFLTMEIPPDRRGEWTVENELARMEVHDQWLRKELGNPPYDYSWGQVVSDYDQKGCASTIIVAYAP